MAVFVEDTILKLQGLKKQFGQTEVLKGIDIEIARGEFITLLGASGCGKTTTLRIIAGMEEPDEGQVILDGKNITGMAPEQRNVNTVFQNYALFPYMNVETDYSQTDVGQLNTRIAAFIEML